MRTQTRSTNPALHKELEEARQQPHTPLFDALEMQGEREAWLQENKEAINAKIELSLAQLDRGEAVSGDTLRKRLEADKSACLADCS